MEEEIAPENPEWNGDGVSPLERQFMEGLSQQRGMGQLSQQRSYLEQVLEQRPPPEGPVTKELAAGLPMDAAKALVLTGPELGGVPCWNGMPADAACIAASLRVFGRLMPGKLDEQACERFVSSERLSAAHRAGEGTVQALEEMAAAWGMQTRRVPSAAETLKAMVRGRPAACCIVLEGYVGVLEDPESGEELEHEVGGHCLLVVGGDLLGPNYIIFDPYGLRGGEVCFWSEHNVTNAAPVTFVEFIPRLE